MGTHFYEVVISRPPIRHPEPAPSAIFDKVTRHGDEVMNWLFDFAISHPVAHAVLILAIVARLGHALGSVRIRGIGLGISGVLLIFTRQSCPPVSSLAKALAKAGSRSEKLDRHAFFLAGRNEYW